MSVTPVIDTRVLPRDRWRTLETAHHERADALTAGHRERAARGQTHPVEDFLFTYYSYKPAVLRRWHPGQGVELREADDTERRNWRWYAEGAASGSLRVDTAGFRERYGALILNIRRILVATTGRTANFRCFGLHEWAMVYREDEHRHPVPLRLGGTGTDAVVEAHDLACTHFDAYRFFTPEAVPRNATPLDRASQVAREQPGCLHAGMDLYKWAIKLGPLVPGDLLLDTFELARDIRVLDMRASPYDLTDWGYEAVAIETAAGKADYVRGQRGFAERGEALRTRLISVIDGESN
ncbi:3-methyladenine DNA glycosylase [Microbacterium sp. C7(2022)]|uniref:3-methyladenine DNA glycosylase n=1 Tax=Microbacterium sp. C7(2022) TaxID=2992759 RepID=UPI00237A232C|nr:3-methyladenine DNA glycosylase [Microbacterium sp. C7(2022)]MDE0547002.1 3-methyladenine DNA glycosylase [Microbacterium sp. C7(2022)]